MNKYISHNGFGVMEVVVGAALVSLVLISLVGSFQKSIAASREVGRKLTATFLAEEGMEVVRIMRDQSWENLSDLSAGTTYRLVFSGGTWATTTVSTPIFDRYYRDVTIADVLRDGNDDIAESGTLDPLTRKVTITVSWLKGSATTSVSLSSYFAQIF